MSSPLCWSPANQARFQLRDALIALHSKKKRMMKEDQDFSV